ncbi:unnamed protein product [marine sediment metagenome]|uniref:Uncharacterized protein n=1 Tax=marine sediment metagenome TaxID=412755 RepID=X0VXS3_9ZZZZ
MNQELNDILTEMDRDLLVAMKLTMRRDREMENARLLYEAANIKQRQIARARAQLLNAVHHARKIEERI